MAFYLRRVFCEKKNIHVLNGPRLERGDSNAAQIDHLILLKAGMVIVESKCVHGCVGVNGYGEWTRVFGSRAQGVTYPIEQARRQATFRSVSWMTTPRNRHHRPLRKTLLPGVCKVHQATAKVEEILAGQRGAASVCTGNQSMKAGRELTRSEMTNILVLLSAEHCPGSDAVPAPHPETLPAAELPLVAAEPSPVPAEAIGVICGKTLDPEDGAVLP